MHLHSHFRCRPGGQEPAFDRPALGLLLLAPSEPEFTKETKPNGYFRRLRVLVKQVPDFRTSQSCSGRSQCLQDLVCGWMSKRRSEDVPNRALDVRPQAKRRREVLHSDDRRHIQQGVNARQSKDLGFSSGEHRSSKTVLTIGQLAVNLSPEGPRIIVTSHCVNRLGKVDDLPEASGKIGAVTRIKVPAFG